MSELQAEVGVSTSEAAPTPASAPATAPSHEESHEDNNVREQQPPTPIPATDPKLQQGIIITPSSHKAASSSPDGRAGQDDEDIFHVPPLTALRLLSARVEMLVAVTGDIPPTPPPKSPTFPNMRGMQAEKESIVRSHSERSLLRLLSGASGANSSSPRPGDASLVPKSETATPLPIAQPIDGVHLRAQAPPELVSATAAAAAVAEPYIVVGENLQPLNLQHSAITRKFYSKLPPPISITDYLLRIHRFCPMSTAVYLATSLYMHRLAVTERAIAVTRRNVHRLLLAGLRVAMKALEDLSYSHSKIAKVGGVSEAELARLEISFCFLVGFELVVREEALTKQWEMLRAESASSTGRGQSVGGIGALRLDRPPRGSRGG